MEALILRGVDVNQRDAVGDTPLMYAVLTKDVQKVDLLVKYGADITAKNQRNQTAVEWAHVFCLSEIIEWFIRYYTIKNREQRDGLHCLSWCTRRDEC